MNIQVKHPLNSKVTHSPIGMTLIELLFVIAIVGLLAALAMPSYQTQVLKSRRGDGINQLLRLKLQQESYRSVHPTYASTEDLELPRSDYFTFSISDESATTYTLIAKAKGGQVNDKACKLLSINQSMQRAPQKCFK
ncbi:type IV pilin protein [Paraglaciecola aquimarina]|uniref:Type IV pilin protein n=1 Tax=Paraglaciecola aquimarina TaxID=1235557 RepID=A0ABU3T1L6_9ALTE|nr:type IV pilin protein [Paraglaciecola aquimarina]MDU0356082.1 type IV pilin protein [Paraglaciecola aquimarina]